MKIKSYFSNMNEREKKKKERDSYAVIRALRLNII